MGLSQKEFPSLQALTNLPHTKRRILKERSM
jgi:hypothetical protein